MRVLGPINWRLSRPADRAYMTLARTLLGVLRSTFREGVTTGAMTRIYGDTEITVAFFNGLPVVTINSGGEEGGEKKNLNLAVYTGSMNNQFYIYKMDDQQGQTRWLGKLDIDVEHKTLKFGGQEDIQFVASMTQDVYQLRAKSTYTGKAKLLVQAWRGAESSRTKQQLLDLTDMYDGRSCGVGIYTEGTRYWLLAIKDGVLYSHRISFGPVGSIVNAATSGYDEIQRTKAEVYMFADCAIGDAETIGPISIDGDPYAYSWKFNRLGTKAAICTHEYLGSGLTAYQQSRLYILTISRDDSGFSFDLSMDESKSWTHPALKLIIWTPYYSANWMQAKAPSDLSYTITNSSANPIYCWYDAENVLQVVRSDVYEDSSPPYDAAALALAQGGYTVCFEHSGGTSYRKPSYVSITGFYLDGAFSVETSTKGNTYSCYINATEYNGRTDNNPYDPPNGPEWCENKPPNDAATAKGGYKDFYNGTGGLSTTTMAEALFIPYFDAECAFVLRAYTDAYSNSIHHGREDFVAGYDYTLLGVPTGSRHAVCTAGFGDQTYGDGVSNGTHFIDETTAVAIEDAFVKSFFAGTEWNNDITITTNISLTYTVQDLYMEPDYAFGGYLQLQVDATQAYNGAVNAFTYLGIEGRDYYLTEGVPVAQKGSGVFAGWA